MKRILLLFILAVFAMGTAGYAQQGQPLFPDNVKYLHPVNKYINSVSMRAMRDFVKQYNKATDVSWYNLESGFMVRFVTNGIPMRAAYSKRGNWVYTIKMYHEADLQQEVRHVVKSVYYDYEIRLVEEISQPNESTRYVLHLEDPVSWKNVVVWDGRLEVMQEYKKQ